MKFIYAALALAALLHAQGAHAECRKIVPADEPNFATFESDGPISYDAMHQVSFGTGIVDVESTLEVGETIALGSSAGQGRMYILVCTGMSGAIQYELTGGGSGIQPTGVPGVGYRVIYKRASGTTETFPYTNNWTPVTVGVPAYVAMAANAIFQIELVKTGEMESESTVNLGTVGRIYGTSDGVTALTVISDPVTLRVLPHCQVTSAKPLLVEFGPFGPRDVSATSGPTRPVTLNVACDGPTPPNTVSATLAAPPDPDASGFIRNDGTASGLAIRLRDAATQAVLKPQDLTSALTKSSPGYNTTFDLEASVLRVGAAAPVPGSIDAQGTITLTFL